jgi:Uma2 family endonuclease
MSTATGTLITADEFVRLHGDESGVELVRGRVVRYPMPSAEHGRVCSKVNYFLTHFVMERDAGRVFGNDTFVRTGANPDTYRGADVCFLNYVRMPKEQSLPGGHWNRLPT